MVHGILHDGPRFEVQFTLVQAGEQVGQTVFENFEQGERERVAPPLGPTLQFDQAQHVTAEMDEIDAALVVGAPGGDPCGTGHWLDQPGMCPRSASMATAFSSVFSGLSLSSRTRVAYLQSHSFFDRDRAWLGSSWRSGSTGVSRA